jgi:hypothetical protein
MLPNTSLPMVILPFSTISTIISIYKYFKGYSTDELINAFEDAQLLKRIKNYKQNSTEFKNYKEQMGKIKRVNDEIIEILENLSED